MIDVAISQMQSIGEAIRAAVAPVFLLSGVGILLTVLTNRLARTVDRARVLQAQRQSDLHSGTPASQPGMAADPAQQSLPSLAQRARLLSYAITLCTVCALLISMVVIVLFLGAFLDFAVVRTVGALFIAAMLCFVSALLCFLREVYLATASLRIVLKS